MKSVGTIWYHPEGVVNILLQYIIAQYSRWSINYSTDKFLETRDVEDLYFNVVTQERFKYKFIPIVKGLHVYRENKEQYSNIFRSKGFL